MHMLRSVNKAKPSKIFLALLSFIALLLIFNSTRGRDTIVVENEASPVETKNLKGMNLKLNDSEKPSETLDSQVKILFKAVQDGHAKFVLTYLESGGDPNVIYGEDKMSLLGAASYHGHVDILKLLLKKGGDPLYIDERGNSVLMLSFFQDQNKEIYKELMKFKFDFNHENQKGQTALSIAVKSFNEKASKALLALEGLSDANLQKSFFESVLNQDERFMGFIYDKFSYAITLEDEAGEDALKKACKEGLLGSLSFLMTNQPQKQKNKAFFDELLEFAKTENMSCYDFLTSA